MSEKKALKRDVKAVWDRVKRLRADRGKSYAPEDIEAAAEKLEAGALQLRELGKKLSALNAMPPEARPAKPPKKAAAKPKRDKKRAAND
jgi:hypothetical protein